jgi:MFS-type transporter involved in bile tolerance (Atg22 family)
LRRAIWLLGAGQCVYWGMLYYGFSVLLVPMVDEFHSTRVVVAGAFSVGLLVMALVAPQIGRWVDRDHVPRVMNRST